MHAQIEQCSDNVRHTEEWIRTCFQPLEAAVRANERRVDVAITAFREGVPSLRNAHIRVADQVQGSANVITQVRIELGDLLGAVKANTERMKYMITRLERPNSDDM